MSRSRVLGGVVSLTVGGAVPPAAATDHEPPDTERRFRLGLG